MGAPGENRSLFLQGAGGEYILILIDGVAINDPSGVGGAIDLRILPTQNIERIEILRGNQSVLYGTDALAGVVRSEEQTSELQSRGHLVCRLLLEKKNTQRHVVADEVTRLTSRFEHSHEDANYPRTRPVTL